MFVSTTCSRRTSGWCDGAIRRTLNYQKVLSTLKTLALCYVSSSLKLVSSECVCRPWLCHGAQTGCTHVNRLNVNGVFFCLCWAMVISWKKRLSFPAELSFCGPATMWDDCASRLLLITFHFTGMFNSLWKCICISRYRACLIKLWHGRQMGQTICWVLQNALILLIWEFYSKDKLVISLVYFEI